jgi:hypothetical protein
MLISGGKSMKFGQNSTPVLLCSPWTTHEVNQDLAKLNKENII